VIMDFGYASLMRSFDGHVVLCFDRIICLKHAPHLSHCDMWCITDG
jgi:hypothetical protein